MKLLVQPIDGIAPLNQAIVKARRSVDIVIFRCDRKDLERELQRAVARGVTVRALIACLNRGGEKELRKLEMRLLQAGVTVARTADDLVRYHDKFMIIDRKTLYVLAFNFTHLDIDHSRSFGVATRDRPTVKEALKLFEADAQRRCYLPALDDLVVSPGNARQRLASFIRGAKRRLLIYDPRISDATMIRLLAERARQGVEIRIVGRLTRRIENVQVRRPFIRLHTRTIVRDRSEVFVGSQSLSDVELDLRREVGLIVHNRKLVDRVIKTFEEDWSRDAHATGSLAQEGSTSTVKATKKAVKAIARELPPMAPILEEAVRKVVGDDADVNLDRKGVEETVRGALKEAVREVVKEAVQDVVGQEELTERVPG